MKSHFKIDYLCSCNAIIYFVMTVFKPKCLKKRSLIISWVSVATFAIKCKIWISYSRKVFKIMHLYFWLEAYKTSTNIFAVSITRKGSSTSATRNKFLFALSVSQIISATPAWLNILTLKKWLMQSKIWKLIFKLYIKRKNYKSKN